MIRKTLRSRLCNPLHLFAVALGLALLGVTTLAQPALAQDDVIIARVVYMKAEPADAGDYVTLEREIWKPIHQERANDGRLLGWDLYAVRYPEGTGHDYNYLTVEYYDTLADLDSLEYERYAERAHPDKDLNELVQQTYDARDLVRSEVWTRVDEVTPEESPAQAPFLEVSYMKVEPGGIEEYVSLEQDIWKPVHQVRLDAEMIAGWALWQMALPGGTSQPYNHATATIYRSMADMSESYPENVWEEVHPDPSTDEITQETLETRDLVQTELWELIDSVSGAAEE